jgi:hypothetical protein
MDKTEFPFGSIPELKVVEYNDLENITKKVKSQLKKKYGFSKLTGCTRVKLGFSPYTNVEEVYKILSFRL